MNLLQIHEPGQTPLPHADENKLAVGIDLGTTHSVVAVATHDGVEVITDEHGEGLVPSVVQYKDGKIIVGTAARQASSGGEKDAVTSIKRLMGKSPAEARAMQSQYPLAAGDDNVIRLELGGRKRTAVEVSADILRALKHMATQALGKEVTHAVITVPAYFDDAARTTTKDAAKLAGLEVLRLINEPTAAALAYGLDNEAEGIYAVYDLGGGTFDISILKLEMGVFQVLATGGDTLLGGDDIDHALAEHIAKETGAKNDAALLAAAREIKEKLSVVATVNCHPGEGQGPRQGSSQSEVTWMLASASMTITRETLEKLAAPFIAKTLDVCKAVLKDAKLEPKQLKGVVLVGGATRMPYVRHQVEKLFEQKPLTNVDPDKVVAVGAALQAQGLTQGSDNLLLDVVPLSLGLETMGGLTEKIIQRNTPIPVSAAQEFTTYQDNQNGMQIHVLQGEREMVDQNRSLARFELKGIPALPAGIARIKVTFDVDADGLLTVSAEEKTTGTKQWVEVKPTYGLPPEEMRRMLLESQEHAKEDILQRLLVEAKVDAERNIIELESAIKQDAELLSEPEKKLITAQIGYLREAINEGDRERMDMEIQQLARLAQPFAERRMNKAVASKLKGAHISSVE